MALVQVPSLRWSAQGSVYLPLAVPLFRADRRSRTEGIITSASFIRSRLAILGNGALVVAVVEALTT